MKKENEKLAVVELTKKESAKIYGGAAAIKRIVRDGKIVSIKVTI